MAITVADFGFCSDPVMVPILHHPEVILGIQYDGECGAIWSLDIARTAVGRDVQYGTHARDHHARHRIQLVAQP
jgi:hypothetical protein